MSDVAVKSKSTTKSTTKNTLKAEEPKKFNVVFMNDNFTPMDFVIQLLQAQFGHVPERAFEIMMEVHERGSGVAATLHFELAEQKALECTYISRQNGHPLEVKVKPA